MDSKINLDTLISKSDLTLGVLSDTHNQLNDIVLESLQNCDVIVHAGDIGDANVLNNLGIHAKYVFPVRGNNDTEEKWPEQDLAALENIPDNLELHFNNKIIAVTHGHQFYKVETRHDKLREQFPHADIIIYGHSHRIACDRQMQPWVINPGAGGYTRTFGGASCIKINYTRGDWSVEKFRVSEE